MKVKINGIFGKYNSEIDLDNRCTIFIGENGSGKSTTLKILNYVLQGDFVNITKYNFESIEFQDKNNILKIYYEDFLPSFEIFKSNLKLEVMHTTDEDIEFIKEIYLTNRDKYFDEYDVFMENSLSEELRNKINRSIHINLEEPIFLEVYKQIFFEEMAKKGFSNKTKRLLRDLENYYFEEDYNTIEDYLFRLVLNMQKNIKTQKKYKIFGASNFENLIDKLPEFITPNNDMFMLNMYNTYQIETNTEDVVENKVEEDVSEKYAIEDVDILSCIKDIKENVNIKEEYNLFDDINKRNTINISKLCFYNYFKNVDIKKILKELYEELEKYCKVKDAELKELRELFGDDIESAPTHPSDLNQKNIVLDNLYDWFIEPMLPTNSLIDILPRDKIFEIFYNNITQKNYYENFDESLVYMPNDKIKMMYTLINSYITNKKIFATPTGMKISNFIEYDEDGKLEISDDINFEFLSEGEKRLILIILISVFCDDAIIVLDEPETSLSLIWQENLIPDLLKNTKVKNIIVATQSPYITNDESLSDCISCIIGDDN